MQNPGQASRRQTLRRLLSYLSALRSKAPVLTGCLLLTTAIHFFQPLIVRAITDQGMIGGDLPLLARAVLVLLLLVMVEQGVEVLLAKTFSSIYNATYTALYTQAFQKILRLKMAYYNDRNHMEVISQVQTDVGNVASIADRYVVMVVSNVFQVLSGLAGLLFISWKLTLVVLALAPAHYFVAKRMAGRKEKTMQQMIDSSGEFYGWMGDSLGGIREIKLLNLFSGRFETFRQKMADMLGLIQRSTVLDAWNSFWEVGLNWLVTALNYLLGGALIATGGLSVGGVFAFISYSGYVTSPISYIFSLRYFFSRIFPSARRLFTFLDLEQEQPEGAFPNGPDSAQLVFDNVSFAYTPDKPVLRGIRLTVEPGEKVAVIGQNGSGKTTLMQLLLRFLEPSEGRILLNGMEVSHLALDAYRALFSVVSQDPYLFNDTVRMNIDPKGTADPETLERALRQSGAQGFIQRLPQGLDSRIGRNGARLSGGEKQKLAVARALILDTPVVVLDEATSGFDVESDAGLHEALLREFPGKTVVMITHRYVNLQGVDRVFRLEDGCLLETRP